MNQFLVLCCILFSCALATNTKRISLEDIERDNLRSEKRPRPVGKAAQSPTQFGFVPVKTVQDYTQQGPKQQYVQSQYTGIQNYQDNLNYQSGQALSAQQIAQQYSLPQYTTQQYTTSQESVQQPQQYYTTQYQPQAQQYQQYENVQYITDNSIGQKQNEQYYPQQYVYLQQYPASSTSIQSVVDTKGQLQYIMYIPSYVAAADQTQNYQTVVYADQPQYTQSTQAPAQQVEEKQLQSQPQTQPQPQQAIQYVAEEAKPQYIQPREPKSLLDSYVPSILQIQYYKQQQQNLANSLSQSQKLTQPITGKTDYVKGSYRLQNSYKQHPRA